jgi:hypothetical protein
VLDIVFRSLLIRAKGQRIVHEVICGSLADVNAIRGGVLSKFSACLGLMAQIASYQARISLTDCDEVFACPMMRNLDHIKTGVWLAVTKYWNV